MSSRLCFREASCPPTAEERGSLHPRLRTQTPPCRLKPLRKSHRVMAVTGLSGAFISPQLGVCGVRRERGGRFSSTAAPQSSRCLGGPARLGPQTEGSEEKTTPRVPWKQGMPAAPRRPQQQSAQVPPRALRASAARCAPRTRRRAARGGAAAATRTPRAARAAAVGGKRLRGAGPPQRRSPRRNPRTAAAQAAPALRR